jgi:hypothetical protein
MRFEGLRGCFRRAPKRVGGCFTTHQARSIRTSETLKKFQFKFMIFFQQFLIRFFTYKIFLVLRVFQRKFGFSGVEIKEYIKGVA